MLQVKNLSFRYFKIPVLTNVSFTASRGEYISIIGESGCGKSTLLKLLYGEYDLDAGEIFWENQQILGPKYNLVTGSEYIKYVAQEFNLMPYTTVEENIGKYLSNSDPKQKRKRISELLDVVELSKFSKTKVKLLSGGQKQRVALAKAIARQPELILLDEPFSHIDNFKKQSLRRNFFSYLKDKKITCIVATHDKDDVLGYADTLVVLNNSTIIANNTPEQLFKHPKHRLIASFFDEFNTIAPYGIVYAHCLQVVAQSNYCVTIQQSYFKGTHYLITAKLDNHDICFYHNTALQAQTKVFLEVTRA